MIEGMGEFPCSDRPVSASTGRERHSNECKAKEMSARPVPRHLYISRSSASSLRGDPWPPRRQARQTGALFYLLWE